MIFRNVGSMSGVIEKVNNAQKVFGKPKQPCRKKIACAAMLTVVCCSGYALSEQNTGMRKKYQGRSRNTGKRYGAASVQEDMKLTGSSS